MSTRKFAISSNRFGSFILGAAVSFGLGICWPLLAQTSEDHSTTTESSEASKTKDTGKTKHAEGSYSADQAPEGAVPSNDQLIKLLREQNARLKKENAQLKAEIAKLKASK
jgi:hypothetical protein